MTFHDIFSKKKEPPSKKPSLSLITIDLHEKNSLVPAELAKTNIPFKFEHLKIGDYLINNTLIERKTISDLKSSVINKRIFDQINNLKQHDSFLLVIEGPQKDFTNNERMHENALRGFLLSLAYQKVPVILTQNEKDTAQYLALLARKSSSKEISPRSLRPKPFLSTPEQQVQFILEGFPGIGPVAAQELLEHFGSLNAIVSAPEEELEPILGKRTSEFKALLALTVSARKNI